MKKIKVSEGFEVFMAKSNLGPFTGGVH